MKYEMEGMEKNVKSKGVLCGALSYILWGVLPLYWKQVKGVPAHEILSHRIVWSFVFILALLFFTRKLSHVREAVKDKKSMVLVTLASLLVGANWFIYIWAVNSDHIVEASMGYYINPLMSILLGMIFFKEKLNRWQYTAIAFAAVGVVLITVQYGAIPWISLALAVTFALYGLCKKLIVLESSVGLALETAVLTPIALAFLLFQHAQGNGAFGTAGIVPTLFLAGAGIATATPLLLFAESARRVSLSMIGFLQYLSPSLSLLLGIVVFKETFSPAHMVSFGFIWVGLAIFTLSQLKLVRKLHGAAAKTSGIEG